MEFTEFSDLVLDQSEGLKLFAFMLTLDKEAGHELYQETLCQAFDSWDNYHHGDSIRAWLFTIMCDVLNKNSRLANCRQLVLEELNELQNLPQSPEINIHLKEIHSAISELSRIFKIACLVYLDGYTPDGIAQSLHKPLLTIENRIHTAKKNLLKKLEQ